MMKKWVDFVKIKFHSTENIEWHCLQDELNWIQIQVEIKIGMSQIYLWGKVVYLCYWSFQNHNTSCHALATLESPRWLRQHSLGFIMFQPILEKILSIE